MAEIVVARGDLGSNAALRLITALNAELSERYPEEGATHFRLDTGEVAPGRGLFLILCTRAGFGPIRRFGEGWTHPLSVFLGKRLA